MFRRQICLEIFIFYPSSEFFLPVSFFVFFPSEFKSVFLLSFVPDSGWSNFLAPCCSLEFVLFFIKISIFSVRFGLCLTSLSSVHELREAKVTSLIGPSVRPGLWSYTFSLLF